MPDSTAAPGLVERRLPPAAPAIARLHRVREPGDEDRSLLRLERNERLGELPPWFVERLRAAIDSAFLTTYPVADGVYRKLARSVGKSEAHVLLTAGSDAAVKALFHAYVRPGDGVVALSPSYAMYAVYAEMFQARLAPIPFDAQLCVDEDALLGAIAPGVRLVMLANPNQPTGTMLPPAMVERVLERARTAGALVALDEAYFPFSRWTALPLTDEHPHLVVVRTFSKAGGLAAARIGFAVGDPEVIGNLFKVRSVHDINSFALAAAELLLDHPEVTGDYADAVEAGRRALERRLEALRLPALPTHANFVLIRVGVRADPGAVVRALRGRGCLVKGPFSHPGMADCIRVTLGPPAVMERFAALLEHAVRDAGEQAR